MDSIAGGQQRLDPDLAGGEYGFSASLYLPLATGVILFLFIMIKLALRALDQFNPNPNRAVAAPARARPQGTGRNQNADAAQNRNQQNSRGNRQTADEDATDVRRRRPEQTRVQQRLAVDQDFTDSGSDSDDYEPGSVEGEAQRKFGNSSKKIGAKKMRKLQEKADRRAAHEVAQRDREERRERERAEEEMRREQDEIARREEAERREAEARARAERERQEQEEYERFRAQFAVDESGQLELDDEAAQNRLAEFVDYITKRKVCMLDELANRFGLRSVSDTVDRIQQLIVAGRLSGILDDRGKFIYISTDEYEAAARLVRQAGRISIAELTEQLGRVIKLRSDAEDDIDLELTDENEANSEAAVDELSADTALSVH